MAHLHHRKATHTAHAPATRGNVIHWAHYYDPLTRALFLGRDKRLRRATVEVARIAPGAAVLEVGCGTGEVALVAKAAAGAAGSVIGIDPAPEMIAAAAEKAAHAGLAIDFQVGVIEALAFPDASFDVVLSSLMMHHLPDELKREGLAEIARVLKPGGRVLIVDVKRPTTRFTRLLLALMLHGALRVGVQDLPELLSEAGFTQVRTGALPFRALGWVSGQIER
jgi:ubiquinone/menaquinone biosynthesis C-methylase UbiE